MIDSLSIGQTSGLHVAVYWQTVLHFSLVLSADGLVLVLNVDLDSCCVHLSLCRCHRDCGFGPENVVTCV